MAAEANEEEKNTKKTTVSVAVPRPAHPYRRAPNDLKVVALQVSRDDTVASVKARLHGMEGIPPDRQRLVFAAWSALPDDDDTTLGDHGVTDSSTIQLVETKMQVFVRRTWATFSGVESSDTVESFRLRVQEQQGILNRPARLRLIYNGRQMEDGHTLADYGVQHQRHVELVYRLGPVMRHRLVELDIEDTDTVGRIKERVQEAEGVPVACQSVYFGGVELDDGRTLAHYGALEMGSPVKIHCERHESGGAAKMSERGDAPMVVKTETLKRRRAEVEVTGPEKKFKKRKKNKQKPLEAAEIVPAVQWRRFRLFLVGPELWEICPCSCDMDPAP